MRRLGFGIAILIILAGLGALTQFRVHSIRAIDHDAQLMWGPNEALLFIGMGELGKRETLAQIPLELIFNYFGGTFEATDSRRSLVVIRYSNGVLEKRVLNDMPMNSFTVFDGQIYNAGGDRWSGSGFDRASEEEANRFYANMRGYDTFHPNAGWSYRAGVLNRPELEIRFPMQVSEEQVELIVQRYGEHKSIQLKKADGSLQDVWQLDERRRWIREEEYARHFPK